jgi:hypothetical protein
MRNKKNGFLLCGVVCVLAFSLMAAGCSKKAPANATALESEIENLTGVDWLLTGIKDGETVIALDRAQMETEDMGGWFTLRFGKDENGGWNVSGIAGDNNYRSPCEWGDGAALTFGLFVSTKKFSFKELPGLKEHDYFVYMEKVTNWALTNSGVLELRGANDDGAELVLSFAKN